MMKAIVHPSGSRLLGNRHSPARSRSKAQTHPRPPLPVFIAYNDVAAARHAMTRVTALLRSRQGGLDYQMQPMLWRFNQLEDPRWRETALADACRAGTLVLAMSNASALDGTTDAWLAALARRQRGTSITALALVGEEEAWTISLQQTAAPVAARAAHPTQPQSASTVMASTYVPAARAA